MNPLMQTIYCLKIRMVKCLPGTLVLTAGMDRLEEDLGSEKVSGESSCECHHDTSREEDKPQTKGFIRSKGFIQTDDSPESP